jgi:hypothetical protein
LVERLFCKQKVLGSTPKISIRYGQEKFLLKAGLFKFLYLKKLEKFYFCFKKGSLCRIQSNTGGIAENAQANTYPR